MLSSLKQKLSNAFETTKAFFKYSETILLARLQVFSGILFVVIGKTDWTSLSDFVSYKQTMWLAFLLIVNGLMTEYARRRNSDL